MLEVKSSPPPECRWVLWGYHISLIVISNNMRLSTCLCHTEVIITVTETKARPRSGGRFVGLSHFLENTQVQYCRR